MYDVIVAGGGVSGCMAAIAAAREGADTLLIEKYGFCGGSLTNSGVGPMMTFHSQSGQVIGGLAEELVCRMTERGGCIGHIEDTTGYVPTVTPFEPEVMKSVIDEMISEAGLNVLFHSVICGAERKESEAVSVTVSGKYGIRKLKARFFIDATGDGDLAYHLGAGYGIGRKEDGLCQPMTTNFLLGNVDTERFIKEIVEHQDNFNIKDLSSIKRTGRLSVAGFRSQLAKAKLEKRVSTCREDILMFEGVKRGFFNVNSTRMIKLNGTDPEELSRAELEGRKQVRELYDFLRSDAPGFKDSELISTGVQVGVRETRRIEGEYCITADDLINGCVPYNTVALGSYPVDIHNPQGSGTETIKIKGNGVYGIPLRALTVKGFDNVAVCGRCISASHEAIAAVRVSPIAMATGQAAGVLAAQCVKEGCKAAEADSCKVRNTLLRQKAILFL